MVPTERGWVGLGWVEVGGKHAIRPFRQRVFSVYRVRCSRQVITTDGLTDLLEPRDSAGGRLLATCHLYTRMTMVQAGSRRL